MKPSDTVGAAATIITKAKRKKLSPAENSKGLTSLSGSNERMVAAAKRRIQNQKESKGI